MIMAEFPSKDHHAALAERMKAARYDLTAVGEHDCWAWFAYNYGWRRVVMQTRDDDLAIDPVKTWFNVDLAARAEIFWARKLGKRAPDLSKERVEPTPEQIADASRKTRIAVALIAEYVERNRHGFSGRQLVSDREALRRVREEFGVRAEESVIAEPAPESCETTASMERS